VTTAPYILARTFGDAHAYATEKLGLGKGTYRVVNSPATLKAVRGVDLHLVAGHEKRWDRFAMTQAMRWTRMNIIPVVTEQAEEPVEVDEVEHIFDATNFFVNATSGVDWDAPGDPLATLEAMKSIMGSDFPPPVNEVHTITAVPDDTPAPASHLALVARVLPAPAEEPVVEESGPKPTQRRRRCKDCGELIEPADIDAHVKSHEEA
jgi:hypothetical protein